MKKILFTFLIFIGVFLFVPQSTFAQVEQIKNFDSKIQINRDGTIGVREDIVYDFGYVEKHGIFREIPYVLTNKEGKKFRLDIKILSITDETGKPYGFELTLSDKKVKLKIGNPNRTITGVHTYIISYKVAGALTYFSDHDELYWNVNGNDWAVPIVFLTSEVGLPVGVSQNKITTACYTGAVGSKNSRCTISGRQNPVTFQSQDTLRVYEGMTVVVGLPKGHVAVLEPKEIINFWETPLGKMVKKLLIIASIIAAIFWYLVYPVWIPIKWYLYGRDPKVGQEVSAWFDPPKGKDGRFLTPEETGGLIDESVDYRDFSAMLVYLAQKGCLRIEERKRNDFYFVRRSNNNTSLLPHQKYFLQKLFEDETDVRIKDAELYDAVQKTTDMIYTELVEENYFPRDPEKTRKFYGWISGFALITLNFILAFTAFVFGRNMPKKTVEGAETAKVAKSLRNFLTSQERQLAFQVKNQMMFEKLLPYAIAFGVEKIWAKRFENIKLKPPTWYSGYGGSYYSSTIWINSMNSSFSSFRSAATPTSSSSGFSSGFSGGSGGGGGGGGGGSW